MPSSSLWLLLLLVFLLLLSLFVVVIGVVVVHKVTMKVVFKGGENIAVGVIMFMSERRRG